MDQDQINSEKARYKHELQKMDKQLKEYRQNITCGPIGCMVLVLIAAGVAYLVIQERGAAIAVAVVGAIAVAFGTFMGIQKTNELKRKRDEMRGWQKEVTEKEVRQAAEKAVDVEQAASDAKAVPRPAGKAAEKPKAGCTLVMLSAPEDREAAREILADQLEIDTAQADHYLGRMPTVIKSGLSNDAAVLITNRLKNKGFEISIQE